MGTRLELQDLLEELLGSRNVYYQPPASVIMKYPAIRYEKTDVNYIYADNKKYLYHNMYTLTIIDRNPDNPVIQKLLELPMCSYDRNYKSDNLNHDVLSLYY